MLQGPARGINETDHMIAFLAFRVFLDGRSEMLSSVLSCYYPASGEIVGV